MKTECMVSLKNVGLRYSRSGRNIFGATNQYHALRDISLEICKGETLGIIGRNGSGKTSLLKIIAGVLTADYGQIERTKATISMLSLQVGFLPHLTGRENAILGALLLGKTKKEARDLLHAVESFAELDTFFDEPLMTYSSGMKARLGFSVAYYAAADILLIDEVLGVGDKEFRAKSSEAIKDMMNSRRTVVLVSHSLPTMRELADRVVWVEDGVTKEQGPTEAVLSNYLSA